MEAVEFSEPILEAVVEWDAKRVKASIDTLIEAGILNRHGREEELTFAFRHALIQEAAYNAQLRKDRRALHEQIAETVSKDFRRVGEEQPELLAIHWDRADLPQKAAPLYIRAGERALDRLANHEAVAHFDRALSQIGELEPGPEQEELEIEARLAAGQPMAAVHGFGAEPVAANYSRLEDIADQIGTGLDSLPIRMALASYYAASASFDRMRDTGQDILDLAEIAQLPMLEAAGCTLIGIATTTVGSHADSKASLERALEILKDEPDPGPASPTDPDLEVLARATLAIVQLDIGQLIGSRESIQRAVERARNLNHPMTESIALTLAGMLARLRDDVEETAKFADETIDLAGRYGYPFWLSQGEVMRAWADAKSGLQSHERLIQGMNLHLESGSETTVAAMYWLVADAMRVMGRHGEAHEFLDKAFEVVERTGEVGYILSLSLVRAQVLIEQGEDYEKAEKLLREAIAASRVEDRVISDYLGSTTLARLMMARGDLAGGQEAMDSLRESWAGKVDEEMMALIDEASASEGIIV